MIGYTETQKPDLLSALFLWPPCPSAWFQATGIPISASARTTACLINIDVVGHRKCGYVLKGLDATNESQRCACCVGVLPWALHAQRICLGLAVHFSPIVTNSSDEQR